MIEETVKSVLEAEEKVKTQQSEAKENAAALIEEAKAFAKTALTEAEEKAAAVKKEAAENDKAAGEAYVAEQTEKTQRDIAAMKLVAGNNESVAVETILQALF